METVRVAVPEPPTTEPGLKEQAGRGVREGAIVLQEKVTLPLKPLLGAMLIVEVADPPAEIVAGESAEASIVKSGGGSAITVRLTAALRLIGPEVPVMVTLKRPAGVVVEELTVRIEVLEPAATKFGTKEQVGGGVTAGTMLLHLIFTVLAKPLLGTMVIVEVADSPAETIVGESAETPIVKSLTVRLIDTVLLMEPDAPITVMLEVATGVAVVVVIVRVDVPLVSEFGLKAQFAPAGRPPQVRATVPVNPFVEDTVMVDVPDCPGVETLIGVPPTEKFGFEEKVGHAFTSALALIDPRPVTRS